MSGYPKIQIVDENDNPIGGSAMEEAWENGKWHRIVRVMAQADDGSVLLQLRSSKMKIYPNHWDHSAAGHVDEGENYYESATRELAEEAGITGVKLEEIKYYQTIDEYKGYQLKRFNKVYVVKLDRNMKLKKQDEEVTELRWFTKAEIVEMLEKRPGLMTPSLRKVLIDCNFV